MFKNIWVIKLSFCQNDGFSSHSSNICALELATMITQTFKIPRTRRFKIKGEGLRICNSVGTTRHSSICHFFLTLQVFIAKILGRCLQACKTIPSHRIPKEAFHKLITVRNCTVHSNKIRKAQNEDLNIDCQNLNALQLWI